MKFFLPVGYFIVTFIISRWMTWLVCRGTDQSRPSIEYEFACSFGVTVFLTVLDLLQHVGVGAP